MIAQARITSDTTATVHLAEETIEVSGADLPAIRDRVKQSFIAAAKSAGHDVDVVIVEPHVQHHLRVEPSGRITGREEDDRPLYGPSIDEPLIAPPSDDTVDLSGIDRRALRSPATGEHAAIGSPATGELPTVRPHGARRRRVAEAPAGAPTPSASPATSSASTGSIAPTTRTAAGSGASAASASSASSAASAPSAPSAPSAVGRAQAPIRRAAR